MGILLWIGFGLVAGSVAKLAMPGPGAGGVAVAIPLGIGGCSSRRLDRLAAGWNDDGHGRSQPPAGDHRLACGAIQLSIVRDARDGVRQSRAIRRDATGRRGTVLHELTYKLAFLCSVNRSKEICNARYDFGGGVDSDAAGRRCPRGGTVEIGAMVPAAAWGWWRWCCSSSCSWAAFNGETPVETTCRFQRDMAVVRRPRGTGQWGGKSKFPTSAAPRRLSMNIRGSTWQLHANCNQKANTHDD